LLEGTASRNAYSQTVAGLAQNYLCSGTSHNAEVKASYMLYRDATTKNTASLKAWQRKSNNYIEDAEVTVQRTVVGGFDAALDYRQV
jgi:hemolysin activation/secretion protein